MEWIPASIQKEKVPGQVGVASETKRGHYRRRNANRERKPVPSTVPVSSGHSEGHGEGAVVGLQVHRLPVKEALSALTEEIQENSERDSSDSGDSGASGASGVVRMLTEQGDVSKLEDKVRNLWKMAQKENVEPLAVIIFLAYMDNLQKKSALALAVFGKLEHKILSPLKQCALEQHFRASLQLDAACELRVRLALLRIHECVSNFSRSSHKLA